MIRMEPLWWPNVIIYKIYFKDEARKRRSNFEDENNMKIKIKLILNKILLIFILNLNHF